MRRWDKTGADTRARYRPERAQATRGCPANGCLAWYGADPPGARRRPANGLPELPPGLGARRRRRRRSSRRGHGDRGDRPRGAAHRAARRHDGKLIRVARHEGRARPGRRGADGERDARPVADDDGPGAAEVALLDRVVERPDRGVGPAHRDRALRTHAERWGGARRGPGGARRKVRTIADGERRQPRATAAAMMSSPVAFGWRPSQACARASKSLSETATTRSRAVFSSVWRLRMDPARACTKSRFGHVWYFGSQWSRARSGARRCQVPPAEHAARGGAGSRRLAGPGGDVVRAELDDEHVGFCGTAARVEAIVDVPVERRMPHSASWSWSRRVRVRGPAVLRAGDVVEEAASRADEVDGARCGARSKRLPGRARHVVSPAAPWLMESPKIITRCSTAPAAESESGPHQPGRQDTGTRWGGGARRAAYRALARRRAERGGVPSGSRRRVVRSGAGPAALRRRRRGGSARALPRSGWRWSGAGAAHRPSTRGARRASPRRCRPRGRSG